MRNKNKPANNATKLKNSAKNVLKQDSIERRRHEKSIHELNIKESQDKEPRLSTFTEYTIENMPTFKRKLEEIQRGGNDVLNLKKNLLKDKLNKAKMKNNKEISSQEKRTKVDKNLKKTINKENDKNTKSSTKQKKENENANKGNGEEMSKIYSEKNLQKKDCEAKRNNESELSEGLGNDKNEEAQGMDQKKEVGDNIHVYDNEKDKEQKEEISDQKGGNEGNVLQKILNQVQQIKDIEEKSPTDNQQKMNVNPNISVIKGGGKEKKEQKAYLNFIQTLKKANKSRKNKTKNIMEVDPKVKVKRALAKVHMLNRIFQHKKANPEEEKDKQEMNQKRDEDSYKKENIYDNHLGTDINKGYTNGYTGYILSKQNQGVNLFQINLEGTLEEINKIFRIYKIEIDGRPVELTYSKEQITETENDIGKKEPEPFFSLLRKKAMEVNAKKEDENPKLKEMQERVQKYKSQLRKAEEEDAYINSPRKRASIKNTNNEEKIIKANQEKKPANTIANDNKEKTDRERSYSKAMDRFKKRFKRDHSVEVRSKKSERIDEIAKKLENVIGNKSSGEANFEASKNFNYKEQDNNFEVILEQVPVVSKKSKKVKKFEL
jgi:hypothetical protein